MAMSPKRNKSKKSRKSIVIASRKPTRRSAISFESLEKRLALSVSPGVTLTDGQLQICGDTGDNKVFIRELASNQIEVSTDFLLTPQTFDLADVEEIQIETGAGDDLVNLSALTSLGATVDAGEGNDRVFGSAGNDLIAGGDGNDVLLGNAGHDEIHGGQGDDTIFGSAGNDQLQGDSGADSLFGNDGDDHLQGDDHYQMGDGDNQSQSDRLFGGAGDDTLDGGLGDDLVIGDAGNDFVAGSDGNDSLIGGEGDDEIAGGLGDDSITAGAGAGLRRRWRRPRYDLRQLGRR